MKEELLKKIEEVETKISIYADRDQIRTRELESELKELNMQLLDIMVDGNV